VTYGIFGQGNYHVASKLSDKLLLLVMNGFLYIRVTSHTRLRARDCYTSSTLIGGKGSAGPSLLHTTLEGSMEYVNAR
jgi:hypothetical protein